MLLSKHPDLISDQELSDWVYNLVTAKEPESIFLDYKETIATNSTSEKREIAKDISSFANERGGIILYGIPETRENEEPIPVDYSDIGMSPISGLAEVVENVLIDSLIPRLPEFRIREISLNGLTDKVVYMMWHPESWEAPHMIHTYKEGRYYRRGNFRAVIMQEGEIERLYSRRQNRRTLANQFFAETDFGKLNFLDNELMTQLVVCPGLPVENRVEFSSRAMKEWLKEIIEPDNQWLPFILGVRSARDLERVNEQYFSQTEFRLFRNGAASILSTRAAIDKNSISGLRFLRLLNRYLPLIGKFYNHIGMVGDVQIDITFFNIKNIELHFGVNTTTYSNMEHRWYDPTLHFRVSSGAMDLLVEKQLWELERRIMDRFVQCFGEWTIPEYFREDGTPV